LGFAFVMDEQYLPDTYNFVYFTAGMNLKA